WNFAETIGAFILGASVLTFLWNVYRSLQAGAVAGDNPWDAWTLEWATTSPPPPHNFDALPPIRSARPLWDLHQESGVRSQESGESAPLSRSAGPWGSREVRSVGPLDPHSPMGPQVGSPVDSPGGWAGLGVGASERVTEDVPQ